MGRQIFNECMDEMGRITINSNAIASEIHRKSPKGVYRRGTTMISTGTGCMLCCDVNGCLMAPGMFGSAGSV